MASDEYEFVPTKDFEKVQAELLKLKQNPFLSKSESKEMKSSIDALHGSVDNLLGVFKQAHQELTQEERESRVFKRELQPMTERFEKIEGNQETIANGVVVVSDAITQLTHKVNGLHGEFDKLHEVINKLDKKVEKLTKPDSPSSSGSKITRKYYTTRQYQQPNPLGGQQTPDMSSPQMSAPQMNSLPGLDPLSASLQSAQMDSSFGTQPVSPSLPPGPTNTPSPSFYASPITTTVESTPPLGGAPAPIGSSPQNAIPAMGKNDLGSSSETKASSGFSLFKK